MRADMNEQYAQWLRSYPFNKYWRIFKTDGGLGEDIGADDDNDIAPPRDHHISRLADLLVEASDGQVDRAGALRWLLHHRNGRALAAAHKREKGFPMQNRADELEAVVKRAGSFQKLCKRVVAGDHGDITERELTLLATGYAMHRHPDLAAEQAFARRYSDARSSDEAAAFWDACNVIKGLEPARTEPEVTDGRGATAVNDPIQVLHQLRELSREQHDRTRVVDGKEESAFDEITEKARALRKRQPELTEEQAFARIYESPQYRALAKRERKENGFL